jgi:hypothetical protein
MAPLPLLSSPANVNVALLCTVTGKRVPELQAMFPQATNVQGDLERCIFFWLQVMTMVVILRKQKELAAANQKPATASAPDAKEDSATFKKLNTDSEAAEIEEFINAHRWFQTFIEANPLSGPPPAAAAAAPAASK